MNLVLFLIPLSWQRKFSEKDKAAAEKFTRALYKAQQWVDTHSPEEIADAVSPLFKDTSKDITVKVIERYKSNILMRQIRY